VEKHRKILLSVGLSTRSTKKLHAKMFYPLSEKFWSSPWTIRETSIIPATDALEMLAAAGLYGCAGATLLGHGFRSDMVADLVGDGLATASRETATVGKRKITTTRILITDAGRRTIKD
jgi:hypothetical protein